MRRYNIVSGILLILSFIDFALAAPVLVQEKRQAWVNLMHIPKDVIIMLGKRWDEDLEKLWGEYFDNSGHLQESGNLESPATYTSSSSAPSEPDHGSTSVVQAAPAPNPASSAPNPYLSIEPPSPPLSKASTQPSWVDRYGAMWDEAWPYDDDEELTVHEPQYTPTGSGKGDDELHGPLYTPTSSGYGSSGYDSDYEFTKAHALQPNPHPRPSDSSTGTDFDWNYWMNLKDPPSPRPASPNEFDQAHEHYQVGHSSSPSAGSLTESEPDDDVVHELPPGPDPGELHLDHQSLTADFGPVDLLAAIYAAKGKAKETRRISSTARDVGDAAQRELQPALRVA
jgi:hypothetical protein